MGGKWILDAIQKQNKNKYRPLTKQAPPSQGRMNESYEPLLFKLCGSTNVETWKDLPKKPRFIRKAIKNYEAMIKAYFCRGQEKIWTIGTPIRDDLRPVMNDFLRHLYEREEEGGYPGKIEDVLEFYAGIGSTGASNYR